MEASTPLMSNMPPIEIIWHILLQLPMKAVIRCQCVCKQWRSLINDSDFRLSYRGQRRRVIILSPHFKSPGGSWITSASVFVRSTSHDLVLQTHKWPFGEGYPLIGASNQYNVSVLCSCNGFVLVQAERHILLWNPSTKCSTKVLEAPSPEENLVILAGLCYDSCTRDYKAVLLLRPHGRHDNVISVGLRHKEWRPVQFPYSLGSTRVGIDLHNTFHWSVSDIKDWDRGNRIIYFDPVRDEFRILPTPKLRENSIAGLGVIADCLCMATCIVHKEEEPKTLQVLIMKEYGKQESWMTAFAIQMPQLVPDIYRSYGLTFYSQKMNTQEEGVLFLSMGLIYVYDPKKVQLKQVLTDLPYFASMCFYVESLACLPLQIKPHD